jgi:hypothetical protein
MEAKRPGVPDFSGRLFPPPLVLRGRIEVGVPAWRRRSNFVEARAPTLALPRSTRGGDKTLKKHGLVPSRKFTAFLALVARIHCGFAMVPV